MKLPRALLTLTAIFAALLVFIGTLIADAIRRRNLLSAIAAAAAAAAACGIVTVTEDYCRMASFNPKEYFSVSHKIDTFFAQTENSAADDLHD